MEKPFVLLADENEAICTLIAALLQRDCVVDIAHDGVDALEKLKKRQYAAVLLDVVLPLLDGYAILDFLREQRPDLLARTIVVTGALTRRDAQRVRDYGIAALIPKPFEVDTLYTAVQECIAEADGPTLRGPLLSSSMIFLIGELLLRR